MYPKASLGYFQVYRAMNKSTIIKYFSIPQPGGWEIHFVGWRKGEVGGFKWLENEFVLLNIRKNITLIAS